MDREELRHVAERFAPAGSFRGAEPLGRGHIHATFRARCDSAGPLVLQRLHTGIFRDPQGLMHNVVRVTEHLRERLRRQAAPDAERRHLTVVRTRDGEALHEAPDGSCWRAYRFLEGTRSFDTVGSPQRARAAGRAFGEFAALLADLPPPPLAETIPHFHDLPRRSADLEDAARTDRCGRAAAVAAELDAARRSHERVREALAALPALPRRVFHHDCKLNNLLFDARSGEPLCVIDLDTVMEGTALSDFGELVRTAACPAAEDERDLARVRFDPVLFEAIARGYLEGARPWLADVERAALPWAGPTLALMNGLRFLTDHLQGDTYFRPLREGHNLDRSRAQLALAERMLEQIETTRRVLGVNP